MPTRFYPANADERMRGRLLIEWLVVSIIALLIVWALTFSSFVERTDNVVYDTMSALKTRPPAEDIVIVAIDEASLRQIGRFPWPREVHAELLEKLAKAKPRAIGYDVLFDEPSEGDDALVAAAFNAQRLVVPMTFVVPGTNGQPFDLDMPLPALGAVTRIGHVAIQPDKDGIVRRVGLEAGGGQLVRPHFAETLYRLTEGHPSPTFDKVHVPLPGDAFSLGAQILIPFAGPAGSYRTISFSSVLQGEVPPEIFTDKIVLIGSTASGLRDQYAVPHGTMPGVEIMANVLDDLRTNHSVRIAKPKVALTFALLPVVLLLIGFLLFPPWINLLLGLVLIVLTFVSSTTFLLAFGVWMPVTARLIGLMLIYPLWAWRRLEAVSAYMARELNQLGAEPDTLPGRDIPSVPYRFPHEAIEEQTTKLHNAIARVRDLRRFFADSVQGLPDATLILDHDAQVVLANREAEALLAPLGEPGSRPSLGYLLAYLSAEEDGDKVSFRDREIKARDGRIFVFRLVPLLAAQGERVGSIARLTDITTIRLAVRQREDALELLTHDMRSPQASILAILENKDENPESAKARIAGYARRTLDLAENFVQLARAEARNLAEEVLDLSALLMDAMDDQWVLASKKTIKLVSQGEEEEHLVRGDRSLLTRSLINVISNAVKYSESGTTVTCALSVEPRHEGGEPMVLCRITDQGRGIPEDALDSLFERYQRLASVGRRDAGGAGIGLSFVRTVIQRHGGIIEATSPPGEGATFWIWLPQAEDEIAED